MQTIINKDSQIVTEKETVKQKESEKNTQEKATPKEVLNSYNNWDNWTLGDEYVGLSQY